MLCLESRDHWSRSSPPPPPVNAVFKKKLLPPGSPSVIILPAFEPKRPAHFRDQAQRSSVDIIASAVDWSRQPMLVAPSMNEVMWNQPATQRNVAQLRTDGCEIIEPAEGWQACRTEGIGRLAEPDAILDAVISKLTALTRA